MDRIAFINSIDDIRYPEMISEFFDQFIALKQLVAQESGDISVDYNTDKCIGFKIKFKNDAIRDKALENIVSYHNGLISIYGKPIRISVQVLDNSILAIELE